MILATIWVGDQFIRSVILTASEPRTVSPRGSLSDTEKHTIELFEEMSSSVVYIVTKTTERQWFRDVQKVGMGSGFLWDRAGHIVTNHHVLSGATEVFVKISDIQMVPAKVVGIAPDYDLAVLKLSRLITTLSPVPVGSSKDLKVGQSVYAIGNPFGLDRTLTTGIISALNRTLPTKSNREIRGVIQTDAAINPGNSGGPLLDSAGRLIGVNTAIISKSGGYAGIGFAVPVDIVNRIIPEIIANGRIERPGIGIAVLSEEQAAQLDITGVVVTHVTEGSSAQAAGIQGIDYRRRLLGDVITHINGKSVRTVAEIAAILQYVGVGNKVEVTVMRGNSSRLVMVTVMDIS
ncbi:MAG: trypsin-like peptidase domain-containing protein [Magnetococcales bacterium]|nr:trypsin-like peptidase domain-containing protein [Magnetococcales bacterium]